MTILSFVLNDIRSVSPSQAYMALSFFTEHPRQKNCFLKRTSLLFATSIFNFCAVVPLFLNIKYVIYPVLLSGQAYFLGCILRNTLVYQGISLMYGACKDLKNRKTPFFVRQHTYNVCTAAKTME